jgi:hypothetical protein
MIYDYLKESRDARVSDPTHFKKIFVDNIRLLPCRLHYSLQKFQYMSSTPWQTGHMLTAR